MDMPTNGRSQLSFHAGKALLKLAQTYTSLFEAVLEGVQNAIDSNADMIRVVINRKERWIDIKDNGDGVNRANFEEALGRVCHSVKERGKLGQFGLGLISPLGKCESFTFTSNAKRGNEGYQEWVFDTYTIEHQSRSVEVPHRKRAFIYAKPGTTVRAPHGTRVMDWRTQVRIRNYTADREVSRIQGAEQLKDSIIEKFGVTMRRNDVTISVRIINEDGTIENASGKAKLFSGKKLPDVSVHENEAGTTTFRLYLARKSTSFGYRGKVHIGVAGDDYRFSFSSFAKGAADYLSDDVIDLFKSGIFEGEIITEKGKLHEGRKTLERNDALVGVCVCIEQWFKDHGKKHMKEVKDERQGQRIQDLSLRSLKNVEVLLSSAAFDDLREKTIGSFKRGTIGEGHATPGEGKVLGPQESPSIATTAATGSRDGGTEGGHSNDHPQKDRSSHAPFTVAGPKGQHRTVVKNGSRGLQFDHVAMGAQSKVWVLEPKNGTLFFNVENAHWIAASTAGDRELMQFQEAAAVLALVHHTMPDEYKSIADLAYGDLIGPLSFLILNSTSFNLKAKIKASKSE